MQKLKLEGNVKEISSMTQMFKDMQLGKDLHAEFVEHNSGSSEIAGVDFNLEVLTRANWPSIDDAVCTLPP